MDRDERRKKRNQERRDNNLCTLCGKPLAEDEIGVYRRCADCRKIVARKKALEREYYKKNGVCPICRVNSLFGGESVCIECRAKHVYVPSEKQKKAAMERYRRNRKERLEKGLCVICGKEPATDGFKSCASCRAKAKRKYKPRTLREERRSQGLCLNCDRPVMEGKLYCEEHYKKMYASMIEARKFKPEKPSENHPWRRKKLSVKNYKYMDKL